MNDKATPIEILFEKAEEYGKTSFELYQLHAVDKTAEVVSSLASRLTVFVTVALFLFIVTIGCALCIGEWLGKSYYGFFVMGGLFGLIALLLHHYRQSWIKYPVSNSIIKQLLKQKV